MGGMAEHIDVWTSDASEQIASKTLEGLDKFSLSGDGTGLLLWSSLYTDVYEDPDSGMLNSRMINKGQVLNSETLTTQCRIMDPSER